MIDTHCHIDGEEFVDDLDEVILRAKSAGIEKIFVPGICMKDTAHLLEVCSRYPGYLYPMVGLHPENVMDEDYHSVLDRMEAMFEESQRRSLSSDAEGYQPLVGVGEIGLDLYWDDTHEAEQIEVFERQIGWAIKYHLPLMLHVRKAHNQLLKIMKAHANDHLTGVFHCFTGSVEQARELLQFPGFMIGIGGVLTFKKSKLPDVLREAVPLDRIVLETDAPYMAPTPHRGKRNESCYVVEVAKMLADIYDVSLETVDYKTTQNALKVFQKCQ